MSGEANNYDKVAGFYDKLSKLVFGRAIINAQVCLLPYIPAGSEVLIVGGGTGWILEEMSKIHSSGLKITYVEISENMLEISRSRNYGGNEVLFVHASVLDFKPVGQYDIVLTPFLFDNFTTDTATQVFTHLHALLRPGGRWLFVDFTDTPVWWQWLLLRTMYLFFGLFSHVEATGLPPVKALFKAGHYRVLHEQFHYGRFIRSVVYH